MFTGIIQDTGTLLESIEGPGPSRRLLVETRMDDLVLGESIAVNGVCLTVAEKAPGGPGALAARLTRHLRPLRGRDWVSPGLAFFLAGPETLARTNLGMIRAPGERVHLERALRAGSGLSGHLVQGHVDGIGTVLSLGALGDCASLEIGLAPDLARYCVEKGSVAVDGVSLTVNEIRSDGTLRIQLIPHTLANTRFASLRAGDAVNIEVDILAKYVEKLCQPYNQRLKA